MVSGVRGRWCLQYLLLTRGINFPLRAWSERGDKWEQTLKTYDVDCCNFTSQLNFLYDGAVLWQQLAPQTQQCCDLANHFCGQGVAGSVMRQSSHEQGTEPVPWDGSSVCALSPGQVSPGPSWGTSALWGPSGHGRSLPVSSWDEHLNRCCLHWWNFGLAFGLPCCWKSKLCDARRGNHPSTRGLSSLSPSSHSPLPGRSPDEASVPMSKVARVAISHVQPQIEPGKQLACSELSLLAHLCVLMGSAAPFEMGFLEKRKKVIFNLKRLIPHTKGEWWMAVLSVAACLISCTLFFSL